MGDLSSYILYSPGALSELVSDAPRIKTGNMQFIGTVPYLSHYTLQTYTSPFNNILPQDLSIDTLSSYNLSSVYESLINKQYYSFITSADLGEDDKILFNSY